MGVCSPLPGKHSFRGAFHHLRPLQSFCSLGYSRPWALGEEYDMNVWCRDEHFEWNKIKIKREDMAAHRYGNERVKCSYSHNLSLDFSSLRRAKQVSLPQRPVIHNALTFRAQDFRFFFFWFSSKHRIKGSSHPARGISARSISASLDGGKTFMLFNLNLSPYSDSKVWLYPAVFTDTWYLLSLQYGFQYRFVIIIYLKCCIFLQTKNIM